MQKIKFEQFVIICNNLCLSIEHSVLFWHQISFVIQFPTQNDMEQFFSCIFKLYSLYLRRQRHIYFFSHILFRQNIVHFL